MQKLNEREKYLADKYVYLIDKYFRMRRMSSKNRDELYGAAAQGYINGVKKVDNAARAKTFIDDSDCSKYYENYILCAIQSEVCLHYVRKNNVSHTSERTAISLYLPVDGTEDAYIGDTIPDNASEFEFENTELKIDIASSERNFTERQKRICDIVRIGMDRKDIAKALSISVGVVKTELKKMRAIVRKEETPERSHIPGIRYDTARKKWICRFSYNENGKFYRVHIGYYPTMQEAENAYHEAAEAYGRGELEEYKQRVKHSFDGKYVHIHQGKYCVEMYIGGKQRHVYGLPNRYTAERIKNKLIALRDDPQKALQYIEEIKAERKPDKINESNITKQINGYTVRMRIDGVDERVGKIPTIEKAIEIRDTMQLLRNDFVGLQAYLNNVRHGSI